MTIIYKILGIFIFNKLEQANVCNFYLKKSFKNNQNKIINFAN